MLRSTRKANPAGAAYAGVSGSLPFVLAKSAIPFINVSSGTMGNNGALSAITALPLTYANAYMWFPAGAIAAGVPAAAGWLFVQMSSTTAGTVFNNTYTAGTVPSIPASPTPFATTGPGAFTGDTTEAPGPAITIPANSMGANGIIHPWSVWTQNNSAGTKTARIRYSGNAGTIYYASALTTQITLLQTIYIANRGATNSQIGWANQGDSTAPGFSTSNPVTSSVDTTASTTLVFSLQKGTATDNKILESFQVELIPS